MEHSKLKTRVICNPASSGGGYDPEELHGELEGYELEWITTQSPGDARKAAKEWRDGLLIVVGGDGTISEVVNGFRLALRLAVVPLREYFAGMVGTQFRHRVRRSGHVEVRHSKRRTS